MSVLLSTNPPSPALTCSWQYSSFPLDAYLGQTITVSAQVFIFIHNTIKSAEVFFGGGLQNRNKLSQSTVWADPSLTPAPTSLNLPAYAFYII